MKTHFIIFALPLLTLTAAPSAAEEACRGILVDGFYNRYSAIKPRSRDRADICQLCASDYPKAQEVIKRARQSGDDGSLGLWIGLFNLDDIEPGNGGARERHIGISFSTKIGSGSGKPDIAPRLLKPRPPRQPSFSCRAPSWKVEFRRKPWRMVRLHAKTGGACMLGFPQCKQNKTWF